MFPSVSLGPRRRCPEKALLEVVAHGHHDSPFQLYYDYFRRFKLSHAKANLLGSEARRSAQERARRVFYHQSRPERPPAFFDVATNWAVSLSLSLINGGHARARYD